MSQAAPFLCDLRDLLFKNLLFEKFKSSIEDEADPND